MSLSTIENAQERIDDEAAMSHDNSQVPAGIEDLRVWIAEKTARAEAYWDQQFRINEKLATCIDQLDSRVSSLEKRVIWWAGVAAGAGAILGQVIKGMFG